MLIARVCTALAAVLVVVAAGAGPANAVIGGELAAAHRYPWLAALGSAARPDRASNQFCAGILVTPDRVLTSAHCVVPILDDIVAIFDRDDMDSDAGTTVHVTDVRVHRQFRISHWTDPATGKQTEVYRRDLALLTLDRPQNRTPLPITGPSGASGTVLGWGATAEGDNSNTRLRRAEVPLVSDVQCALAYGASFDPGDMFCAGSPRVDTCAFDSGGPILAGGALVGLTSWGNGCARPGYPGVYTRISPAELLTVQ